MTDTNIEVLHLIDGLGTGGSERSLAEMLPLLRRRGVGSTVACLHGRSEGVEQSVRAAGFPVCVLPAGHPARVAALRRRLGTGSFDVLHTVHFASDVLGRTAALGTTVPVLSSLVNERYGPHRLADPRVRPWKLAAARQLDAWTARHWTDHLHAVSETVARSAVRWLGVGRERITVVPRGRDPRRLDADPDTGARTRRQLGLSPDAAVLLNVGRREFQKGQAHLLDAVARLLPEHPDVVLLVAGRHGHAAASLERRRALLGLGDRVRFLGHRDDVPALLAAADIFVFPSLYEGMPGAVLEAMACGLPVIATDIPPLAEIVEAGRSALLVPPGDPDALAHAVSELLDAPQRAATLGTRGRSLFEARFTLQRSVAGMADLYRRLATPTSP